MLETIITLFAIYGLAFLIKESSGPCDVMDKARSWLMRNKYVGTFSFKLLDCYFCVGCHCGWIVYLLSQEFYSLQFFILWTLAGGIISLMLSGVREKLFSSPG